MSTKKDSVFVSLLSSLNIVQNSCPRTVLQTAEAQVSNFDKKSKGCLLQSSQNMLDRVICDTTQNRLDRVLCYITQNRVDRALHLCSENISDHSAILIQNRLLCISDQSATLTQNRLDRVLCHTIENRVDRALHLYSTVFSSHEIKLLIKRLENLMSSKSGSNVAQE